MKHMEQINKIREAFTQQAKHFDKYQEAFSNEDYTKLAIESIGFRGNEKVLEIAAGTCGFGRSIAPHVASITELDATEAMLQVGKDEAKKAGIENVRFLIGFAENLPFGNASFDCVVCRLAFHHFLDIAMVFAEMERVLKPGGKLVIIDIEARAEELRTKADQIETLRDPSHVRCISASELKTLASKHLLSVDFSQTMPLPVSATDWLDLTQTPSPARETILSALQEDINGVQVTGFSPYEKDGEVYFNHLYMLFIASK